jgi:hypothetical protein
LITIIQLSCSSSSMCHPFNDFDGLLKNASIKLLEKVVIFKGDDLYKYIDGGADIYIEYGFEKVLTQKISYHEITFNLSIYEMKSADAAYGIFTINQYEGMKGINDIPNGSISNGKVIFSKGRFFFLIQSENFDVNAEKELIYIADKLFEIKTDEKTKVNIDSYLPSKNRIKFSEKYIIGPIGLKGLIYLGEDDLIPISPNTPGYFAQYDLSGKSLSLLVLPFDSQTGKKISEKIESFFKDKFDKQGLYDGINYYMDKKNRFYLTAYKDEKLVLIYRAMDKNSIEKIFKELNSK